MTAKQIGSATMMNQISGMIHEAQASRADIQDITDKVRTSVPYGKVDPQFIVKMMDNIDLYVGYVVDLLDQESDN